MSAPLRELWGSWNGTNQVILPEEAPHESPTSASMSSVAGGMFTQFAYTWAFDGAPQDGLMLIGHDPANDTVTVAWIDSWHMSDKLLLSQGRITEDQGINVFGTWSVGSGPDWGWRIVFKPSGDTFQMQMYNITPDGEEFLGVDATYTRAE